MLGLSITSKSRGGDNMCYSIEHNGKDDEDSEGEYFVNGRKYQVRSVYISRINPSSLARILVDIDPYARFGINHVGGAIFGQNFQAPKYAAKEIWGRDPRPDELPALRLASDIMWAYWIRDNPNVGNLKYYIANHIQNADTGALMARILRAKKVPASTWPGLELKMDTDEAQALLGKYDTRSIRFIWFVWKCTD
jgi:hypothetical protein